MGHSDPSTTARFYTLFNVEELAEQHDRYTPIKQLEEKAAS